MQNVPQGDYLQQLLDVTRRRIICNLTCCTSFDGFIPPARRIVSRSVVYMPLGFSAMWFTSLRRNGMDADTPQCTWLCDEQLQRGI